MPVGAILAENSTLSDRKFVTRNFVQACLKPDLRSLDLRLLVIYKNNQVRIVLFDTILSLVPYIIHSPNKGGRDLKIAIIMVVLDKLTHIKRIILQDKYIWSIHTPVVPVPEVTSIIVDPYGTHMAICFMNRRTGFWYLLRVSFSILNFFESAKEGKLILLEYLRRVKMWVYKWRV